ncbi:MAG: peroxiredoxin [Solirubrobacteraceae bacterium]
MERLSVAAVDLADSDDADGPSLWWGHPSTLLFIAPRVDTTVCTKQFCAYRDAAESIDELDATFVGISMQDMASKAAFKTKYGLTTQLLADTEAEVAQAYGVYAKRFKMAKRTVFIIDEDGRIAHKHANFVSLSFDSVQDLRTALEELPDRSRS